MLSQGTMAQQFYKVDSITTLMEDSFHNKEVFFIMHSYSANQNYLCVTMIKTLQLHYYINQLP